MQVVPGAAGQLVRGGGGRVEQVVVQGAEQLGRR